MNNLNWSSFFQQNANISDHDSTAASFADSGGNAVLGGLLAANVLNPATATAAGVNISPVTQANTAFDADSILAAALDADVL
ncbi:MAG TPA: hypothetical protein VLQ65_00440 [Saliniramus sp.]|nr:hypothetical protein [Saliniramus sp.]